MRNYAEKVPLEWVETISINQSMTVCRIHTKFAAFKYGKVESNQTPDTNSAVKYGKRKATRHPIEIVKGRLIFRENIYTFVDTKFISLRFSKRVESKSSRDIRIQCSIKMKMVKEILKEKHFMIYKRGKY